MIKILNPTIQSATMKQGGKRDHEIGDLVYLEEPTE